LTFGGVAAEFATAGLSADPLRVSVRWRPMPDRPCAFCEIVAGRRPAHVVLDDDVALAFLDVRPLFPGHTLLVPRTHVETLADLPDALLEPYFSRAQRLSAVMEAPQGMGAAGSFVAMNNRVSQSVPHLHTHVVPRNPKDGLRGFFWPRGKYADDDEASAVAARLRTALSGLEAD
jgi:histidine triad (HIT) family protein